MRDNNRGARGVSLRRYLAQQSFGLGILFHLWRGECQIGEIVEWYQVGTIVAANLGLFLWTVRQSRSDYLHIQRSMDSFKDAMLKESKDFHGRLCAIEERNKGK